MIFTQAPIHQKGLLCQNPHLYTTWARSFFPSVLFWPPQPRDIIRLLPQKLNQTNKFNYPKREPIEICYTCLGVRTLLTYYS